jgi:hypothetical protein
VEKKKVVSEWGIPALRPDQLSSLVPSSTYAGRAITDPTRTLCVFRTCRFPATAKGSVLSFFTDDFRFECLWNRPDFYTQQFLAFGWGAVMSPDFSTWRDAPLIVQAYNVYRSRALSVKWQQAGISVIPVLSWSDEQSYQFAFEGIPRGVPVAAVEVVTAGQNDADRRRFLAGLEHAVKKTEPATVLLYGASHKFWLDGNLPQGPVYHLIDSWTSARDRVRAVQEREARERNQPNLFPIGGTQWVAEEAAA